jgi:hypothetical protein
MGFDVTAPLSPALNGDTTVFPFTTVKLIAKVTHCYACNRYPWSDDARAADGARATNGGRAADEGRPADETRSAHGT